MKLKQLLLYIDICCVNCNIKYQNSFLIEKSNATFKIFTKKKN